MPGMCCTCVGFETTGRTGLSVLMLTLCLFFMFPLPHLPLPKGTNGSTRTTWPQRITCKYLRHPVKQHTHVDTATSASGPSFQ